MEYETLNTNFPHSAHQIQAKKNGNQYKLVVGPTEEKSILSIRIMTEDGWKAMISTTEEVEEIAKEYRKEEMN